MLAMKPINQTLRPLAPGKGKWTFAITPHNSAGNGTVNGKALKL